MGRIICVANLKGGVGKTTTAVNLSAALGLLQKKTLLIDSDPQASATVSMGLTPGKDILSVHDAMAGRIKLADAIRKTEIDLLEIIPVRAEFFRAEAELINKPDKEKVLTKILEPIRELYDYIIIDTPPSMGLLLINAMVTADSLLIPLQCEFLAYDSLIRFLRFIRIIKKKLNPHLQICGVLLTMYEMSEKISREIVINVRQHLGQLVFKTVIPRSLRLREASGLEQKPVVLLDPEAVGAINYLQLAREIINRQNIPPVKCDHLVEQNLCPLPPPRFLKKVNLNLRRNNEVSK